jgi:hypothetical protein
MQSTLSSRQQTFLKEIVAITNRMDVLDRGSPEFESAQYNLDYKLHKLNLWGTIDPPTPILCHRFNLNDYIQCRELAMELLNPLSPSIKIPKLLDPYLVGAICGSEAFITDDWVVLRKFENRPAKVRLDRNDLLSVVRVILGDRSDEMYGSTSYFPSDLGYPLNSNLWSQSQANWYRKCHEEEYLIKRRIFLGN